LDGITLVTGATGLVGNNVVRLLLEAGRRVRVLVREGFDSRAFDGLDVEAVRGDVREPESVRAACRGVGCVVHAAARVHIGWSGLAAQRAVNVEGTGNVARAVLEAGARMVHVSSVDTLGTGTPERPADEETLREPPVRCPYVVTKREAEEVILAAVGEGLRAVIVNPAYMLGPWDWKPSSGRMLLEVSRGRAWLAPRGSNSFCDVRDVAEAILAAADRGRVGRRYILAGRTLGYLDAWRLFAEVSGARRPLAKVGGAPLWLIGRFGDLAARLTGREGSVNSAATRMSALERHYTSARAEQELGYRERDLRLTVETAWRWFVDYGFATAGARRP
jgi:dihydroflavonol-4-reductase